MSGRRANHEGSVFERPGRLRADGTREPKRWVVEITVDTPDGPKRKVLYARSQQEAIQRLDEAKLAKRQGRIGAITHQTVGDFLDDWLATARGSIRPSTYVSYEMNVRRAKRYLSHVELDALRPADIQQWYLRLLNEGISSQTVAQAKRVLHIALGDAVRWELIDRNPIDASKPPRVEYKQVQWLRPNEARTLFDKTVDHPLHALWVLLATAGLRIGEALAVEWSDFDPESQTLRIRRAVQRQPRKGLVFVDTKTEQSRRLVYLTNIATNALLRHRDLQDEQRRAMGARWSDMNLIFCTQFGGPLDGTNMYRSLRQVLDAHDIRRVGLHELRHSAASIMLSEEVPLKVVQEILGHTSLMMTGKYSHVSSDLQRDAAKKLNKLFDPKTRPDRELD
jgi:integrase